MLFVCWALFYRMALCVDVTGMYDRGTSMYADSQVKALMVKTSSERKKVGRKKKEKLCKNGKVWYKSDDNDNTINSNGLT
jgi:hypothetical protein